MRIVRLLRGLWLWRWTRAAVELLYGVWVHPTAKLLGSRRQIHLSRGTVVGARTRMMAEAEGIVLTEPGTWLAADIEIQTNTRVRIGSGTTVQRGCMFHGSTRIGRDCLLAPNVYASSRTHPFRLEPHLSIREQERRLGGQGHPDRPIWIQDDCWLGINVVISPGVTVGKGSVVGANAVVTRDVPPYSIVTGIPARVTGSRLAWSPPERIDVARDEDLVYVLSGQISRGNDSGRRRIAVSAEEPLIAAFAASVGMLRVHYHAAAGVTLAADAGQFNIAAGPGFVDVSIHNKRTAADWALFELRTVHTEGSSGLDVMLLERVG